MWRKKTETLVSLAVFCRVFLGSDMSLGLIFSNDKFEAVERLIFTNRTIFLNI